MSVGDSGHTELAFLRACSPSKAIVTVPVVIEYLSQVAAMIARDPDMPARSLRYDDCSSVLPGTMFDPTAPNLQLEQRRIKPDILRPCL